MIYNIQILRAIAAYLVVFHHIIFFSKDLYYIKGINFGMSGVDIFFIISGFIMVYTVEKRNQSALDFFQNRILRIVPLYWLVTIFTLALTLAGFAPFGLAHWNGLDLVTSLLFIPRVHDGMIQEPIVFVGWTLNYEIFFYFWFAVFILFRNRIVSVLCLTFFFVALNISGNVFKLQNAIVGYYATPLILEFIIGCFFGLAYSRLPDRAWEKLRPIALPLALIGISAIALSDVSVGNMMSQIPAGRLVIFGFPAAMIVAAALILERSGARLEEPFLLLQGAASYAIYLVHPLVLQPFFKAAAKVMPAAGPLSMSLTVLAAFAAVCMAGTLMHLFIERPLANFLSGRTPLKAA